jgi:hypothetical protein
MPYIACRKALLKTNQLSEMKKSVISLFLLLFWLPVSAEMQQGEQIETARFRIVKATVEFLASDKDTFKEANEGACTSCQNFEGLLAYASRNKLKKADVLINEWRTIPIDTTSVHWKKSLLSFKDMVIRNIASGAKSKRKQLPGYTAYIQDLDSIIGEVATPDSSAATASQDIDSADDLKATEMISETADMASENDSYTGFLPKLSKDMYYVIIALLLAAIAFLSWMWANKNKALQRKVRSLENQVVKMESRESQSKTVSQELKDTSQKLQNAEIALSALQDDLKAEKERNKRLSAVQKKEKPAVPAIAPPISSAPVTKYARYADQGDGFSVQELLDEEDSETIFEITLLSPTSASFKVSGNQNAQRYALSNSPYFLGKTSQYDTFPSGNSLINTDVPGELILQGGKWLIVKPVQISFS